MAQPLRFIKKDAGGITITKTSRPSTGPLLRVGAQRKLDSQGDQTRGHSMTADWNQEKSFRPPESYGYMPPRRSIATKGNRHPSRTRRGLQKEGQGPQSPLIRKTLQRSILLLHRLGGYYRVLILGIPKARKLVPRLTTPNGARRIEKSHPTP